MVSASNRRIAVDRSRTMQATCNMQELASPEFAEYVDSRWGSYARNARTQER